MSVMTQVPRSEVGLSKQSRLAYLTAGGSEHQGQLWGDVATGILAWE